MEVYSAKIRLMGSLLNEVIKPALTAPEIYILRRLHGTDSILDIKHVGSWDKFFKKHEKTNSQGDVVQEETEYDDAIERERLAREYDGGLKSLGEENKTSVFKMFGEEFKPLPESVSGVPLKEEAPAKANMSAKSSSKGSSAVEAIM